MDKNSSVMERERMHKQTPTKPKNSRMGLTGLKHTCKTQMKTEVAIKNWLVSDALRRLALRLVDCCSR